MICRFRIGDVLLYEKTGKRTHYRVINIFERYGDPHIVCARIKRDGSLGAQRTFTKFYFDHLSVRH